MSDDGECKEKPEGVETGTTGTTLRTMKIRPGFFRLKEKSTEVTACPYEKNCVGSAAGNGTAGDKICSEGSRGPACTVCKAGEQDGDPGYFIDTHKGKCVLCDSEKIPGHTYAVVALLLAMAMTGGAFAVLKLGDTRKRVRAWVHANNNSLARLSETFTVAWVTMQTLVLVVENHDSVGGEGPPSLVGY